MLELVLHQTPLYLGLIELFHADNSSCRGLINISSLFICLLCWWLIFLIHSEDLIVNNLFGEETAVVISSDSPSIRGNDSQRYPLTLINNVEEIVVCTSYKVLNSVNYVHCPCRIKCTSSFKKITIRNDWFLGRKTMIYHHFRLDKELKSCDSCIECHLKIHLLKSR